MARSIASSTTNSASLEFNGWDHERRSSPRSSSFARDEHKATVEAYPAIAPRVAPSPSNSDRMEGHTLLPEGLRTRNSRRVSLHHED